MGLPSLAGHEAGGRRASTNDQETNRRYGDFTTAYEEALTATSTKWAPWHVIPADRNWVRNHAVATVLVEALRRLDPQFPDAAP